jgi:tRNA pseudouridine38-40 synthase
MRNVKLVIEYDGGQFSGWQVQASGETVQGALHTALETCLRTKIRHVQSAGRTDAGVHARGQVVNFFVDGEPDLNRLKLAVSSILRGRVSVLSAEFVPNEFNALNSVTSKCYVYRILKRSVPEALDRGFVWRISYPLNVSEMHRCAQALVGEHDFSSFRAADCGAYSPIKRIDAITVQARPHEIVEIEVIGGGFLRSMVRIIVGTLVEFGSEQRSYSMGDILTARDRSKAGPTAPAHGLCLEWVRY